MHSAPTSCRAPSSYTACISASQHARHAAVAGELLHHTVINRGELWHAMFSTQHAQHAQHAMLCMLCIEYHDRVTC
jgi:hypothetical protein